jgi:segregation and condensation protein A
VQRHYQADGSARQPAAPLLSWRKRVQPEDSQNTAVVHAPSEAAQTEQPAAETPVAVLESAPQRVTSLEDYRVELDAYSGPLDLLLYLVKRHEIDLNDIPIARLTEQYLQHARLIQHLDINLAGEFLVMAATLLEIKSAMLMPPAPEAAADPNAPAPTTENPLDPRFELVQQLLAYKAFKDAANALDDRRVQWDARFPRTPPRFKKQSSLLAAFNANGVTDDDLPLGSADDDDVEHDVELEELHIYDLCAAFAKILDSLGKPKGHQVTYDDTPLELHAEEIVHRLTHDGLNRSMTLRELFVSTKSRSEMIGMFLATLELVRQRRVRVVQSADTEEVSLEVRPEEERKAGDDNKPTDWRDPATGELQYEWPSEKDRLRAERRSKLRATYANKRKSEEELEAAMDELDAPEAPENGQAKEGEAPMQNEPNDRRKKPVTDEAGDPADHADSIAVIDASQAHADDDAGAYEVDTGDDAAE